MMRKFTTCLFISCSTWFFLASCNDDEATAPPKTTFTIDKSAALTGEEVTFVVTQVDADAIAILPYGADETGKGGVLIPKSAFENSVATVKFSYEFVGEFNPVVVASNFTGDGKSIARTYSDADAISISSDKNSIDDFSFDGSTKTTIDQDVTPRTIVVEMPYADADGEHYNVASLKAKFTSSPYTTVTVAGAAQSSGNTVNNFNSPVTYVVTADDGTTASYTVTVVQAPIETITDLKSFGGKTISTNYKDKQLQGYVDNAGNFIVLLAPHGVNPNVFDSVRVKYETEGDFALVHYATAIDTLDQDSLLNLVNSEKSVTVEAQNNDTQAYPIEYAVAPKLELSFDAIVPAVVGKTEEFNITLRVLNGTDLETLVTTADVTLNAGQTLVSMTTTDADDNTTPFVTLGMVDFTKPVKFNVTINDANIGRIFVVTYTATVIVVE